MTVFATLFPHRVVVVLIKEQAMAATERELLDTPKSRYVPPRVIATQQRNVGSVDRWISSIGGGALTTYGLLRGAAPGAALAAVGSYLMYRGISGYCTLYKRLGLNTSSAAPSSILVDKAVTINKSPEELYQFWRSFENLPQFMDHLESVTVQDNQRSHWVAKAPAGTTVAWDAEIVDERANEYISWRSMANADVDNTGTVRFQPGPEGRGTEVHVHIEYNPPAGKLGAIVAKLFGEEPNGQVTEDLRRFKRLMETGEIVTTEGQPHGTRSALGKVLSPNN
jgi:uncharacterized membrane protein